MRTFIFLLALAYAKADDGTEDALASISNTIQGTMCDTGADCQEGFYCFEIIQGYGVCGSATAYLEPRSGETQAECEGTKGASCSASQTCCGDLICVDLGGDFKCGTAFATTTTTTTKWTPDPDTEYIQAQPPVCREQGEECTARKKCCGTMQCVGTTKGTCFDVLGSYSKPEPQA